MALRARDFMFNVKFIKIAVCLITLVGFASSAWCSQKDEVKQANELFKKKQWDDAIDGYLTALEYNQNPHIVQYNLGSAYYKKGNYDQSIKHLEKSISDKNKKLSADAHYNIGNALYKKGRSLENKDIDKAIESLQKSIESYEKTSHLNPKDQDAPFNQKLAQKELERLKKKKEEKKKEEKKKEQDNKKKQQPDQQKQPSEPKKEEQQPKDSEQEKSKDSSQKEEQKSQEQKANEDKSSEEQKENQQGKGQEEQQASGDDQNDSPEVSLKKLEAKRAKEILEDYERQESPKGLLNFIERKAGERNVDKDW
jgi:Ca-activated chloride channel homolog